jgi:glycosyltransferase involved in cell wall biosynthesis
MRGAENSPAPADGQRRGGALELVRRVWYAGAAMRLLVVSDTPFLPPTAGNRQRISELLAFLADAGIELGMLMIPAVDRPEWDEEAMRRRLARFEVAEPPASARLLARLRALVPGARPPESGAPVALDAWCPRWFRARARRLAREWRPDAVMAEYVYLSACLDGLGRRVLRLLDTHDLMHRRGEVYASAGVAPQWFHTTAAEERRGLARADVVLAIDEGEARVLRDMVPRTEVLTVGHGCAVEPLPPEAARPDRLLFVASYNDLNVRGLLWFLDAAWPALRAARPGVELHVCGSIAAKLPPMPSGIFVRGVVPSLRDEYAAARVALDPVAWGTGQPIKVVEAVAHGRPVVSRRPAPAGLEAGVVVGEDAAAFAAGVLALLGDRARWADAARAAARAATAHVSREAAFGPLLARLRAG